MKTIQATTTNLICYMEMNPAIKQKLLQEFLPVVGKHKTNLVENLDYDSVMEFEFLQKCVLEAIAH